jgi:hypothetical protein
MSEYKEIRKDGLKYWKSRSKRVFTVTDNFSNSIECTWQNHGEALGYKHISIFCSIGQFASHISDLLRDYRFDKYSFDESEEINELIFRFYSRILLISSEIFTDFQDLYIIADEKFTTKQMSGLEGKDLKKKQNNARKVLSNGSEDIKALLDFINKICKHKTSNFHLCNNHIKYLFEDFHNNIKSKKKRIEIGNINNFTSYDKSTLKKHNKPSHIVLPKMKYIIDLIINGYKALDDLFNSDKSKFEFICKHYEDK